MAKIKYSLLVALAFTLVIFSSCRDTKEEPGGGGGDNNKENQAINEWIYEEMDLKYFWNDYLPSPSNLNFDAEPDDFFYSTLYYEKDRFSYLDNNGVYHGRPLAEENTPKKDIGFEYTTFTDASGKNVLGLCVTYVKRGSNAENQNLKRGDWIVEVDGERPNINNYFSILYQGKNEYELKLKDGREITLNTTADFVEKPVHLSRIFDEGKIGYIVYNFFDNDRGDKSYEFALDMNNELTKMAGVEYLILDLRYNGGGLVESGAYIASALVPDRGNGSNMNIYTRRAFNKTYDAVLRKGRYYEEQIAEPFREKIVNVPIPELKLKKLYVLTSKNTASASEQIINGLRAYMEDRIEVIGETTKGKNMESFEIKDKYNKSHKWVLHPLTSVSFRADKTPETNDYSRGFEPTIGWERLNNKGSWEFGYENDEFQTLSENGVLYELGDERETLLKRALENIRGKSQVAARTKRSLEEPIIAIPLASSLDRKQDQMIITIKE